MARQTASLESARADAEAILSAARPLFDPKRSRGHHEAHRAVLEAFGDEMLPPEPTGPGPRETTWAARDYYIALAVRAVAAHGFDVTRNRNQKGGQPSASSIVVEVLGKLGFPMIGESRVEQIAKRYEPRHR